jgi:hypothetical protein
MMAAVVGSLPRLKGIKATFLIFSEVALEKKKQTFYCKCHPRIKKISIAPAVKREGRVLP